MNQKIKSEQYTNFGGINAKSSPYITGPMEFLDIINFDFQVAGSLTQRWGSTQYVGQTLAGKLTALTEFTRLDGSSYVIFGNSGGLWSGATTGNSQGLSFIGASSYTVQGSNSGAGVMHGDYDWSNPGIGLADTLTPYQGNYGMRFSTGTTILLGGQTVGSNKMNFAVMNNYLFGCDGNKFVRSDGVTTFFVGVPPMLSCVDVANGGPNGSSITNLHGNTLILVGATGSFLFYGSYVNDRGFEGQIWPLACVNAGMISAASLGGSFIQSSVLIYLPNQYNIASINLYSYWSSATLSFGTTTAWNQPYTFLANVPISGVTLRSGVTVMQMQLGTTFGGLSFIVANVGTFPNTNTNTYFPLGFTLTIAPSTTGQGLISAVNINNYIPQFCEVYKNQLFLGGFSTAPSFVWFSDIGEPEGYPLDNNFEVRTDDGDYVTALKSYFTRLYIFKKHSFHVLSGDSVANYFLQEVSLQYGCVNQRCAIVYNDTLLFLDQKGIVQYNGANIQIISTKVQPIFDSMNYSAALTEATMVHDSIRNQILIGIPINGSATNNVTVVYDYLVNAWSKQDGYNASVFASITGRNNTKNAFYGDYSGRVNWFGPSFLSDNGVGFTTYFKSRFNHDLGESYQKMYRRLYLDTSVPSATFSFNINFYQDYGSSIVGSSTVNTTKFQTRIDYGISAKAIAFELSSLQTSSVLKVQGYTIESRLQRKV